VFIQLLRNEQEHDKAAVSERAIIVITLLKEIKDDT
jgi:hypothetical protein